MMRWPWSTSIPASISSTQAQESQNQNQTQQPPLHHSEPTAAASQGYKTPALSRDDRAEQELESFLKEIDADIRQEDSKRIRVPPSTKPQLPRHEGNQSLSEQLLPKTMSCRTAFDEAFYCNSFGGRFNDLYRYGTLKSCSENWDNFWFCMRTRGYTDKQKEKAIQEHYRKRERMKYAKELGKESSEDIWKSRDKKVEPGEVFHVPFPDFHGTDEEWNRRVRESRNGMVNEGAE